MNKFQQPIPHRRAHFSRACRFPRAGLTLIAIALALSLTATAACAADPDVSTRSLIIAVSKDAPPQIQAAAKAVESAVKDEPLLKLMAGDHDPRLVDSAALLAGKYQERAFNHLIIIGLPDDALVATVWQREAAIEPGGIYVFGFGHFKGDIGYIESDRNPFMHAENIARAPYETEMVTITGTTPAGVALAADAFLHRGIVNGVIASQGAWSRPSTSLLDRDPLPPDAQLPAVPAQLGNAPLIAVTQAAGDEYGNVLADAGAEPLSIFRFKYAKKGAWDEPGSDTAIAAYKSGLHRRAYADTLWVGTFESPSAASTSASKIAAAAGLSRTSNGKWNGNAPPGTGVPINLWVDGSSVYMSDLK